MLGQAHLEDAVVDGSVERLQVVAHNIVERRVLGSVPDVGAGRSAARFDQVGRCGPCHAVRTDRPNDDSRAFGGESV